MTSFFAFFPFLPLLLLAGDLARGGGARLEGERRLPEAVAARLFAGEVKEAGAWAGAVVGRTSSASPESLEVGRVSFTATGTYKTKLGTRIFQSISTRREDEERDHAVTSPVNSPRSATVQNQRALP